MTITNNKETQTLRELVEYYEADGFIIIDSGSSGPTWIDWGEDIDAIYGGVVMTDAKLDDRAYNEGVLTIICNVRGGSQGMRRVVYVSDWSAPAPDGYKYRIIF